MNRVIRTRRLGISNRLFLAALVMVVALPGLAWFLLPKLDRPTSHKSALMCTPRIGTLVHEVIIQGTVESSAALDVACEVESRGSGRSTILELVPEGTYVEEGDFLCRLDSSPIESLRDQQRIICSMGEAQVVEARSNYIGAKIAWERYLKSTYLERQQELEGKVFMAEQDLQLAGQQLAYNRRLLARGYVTEAEVEVGEFDEERAQKDLQAARTEQQVLDDYTKAKTVMMLESRIETTRASLKSEEHSYQLDLENLEHLEDQIEKCDIRSPGAGQVTYVHKVRYDRTELIEEGSEVYQHQVFLRLPDPTQMHIETKIAEEEVTAVRAGMPATIRFNAFSDVKLTGFVQRVSEYPEVSSWFTTKEYKAIIAIDGESLQAAGISLRTGMSAEATIYAKRLENKLLLPLQAVFKHGQKHYCIKPDPKGWRALEVKLGADNGKFVVVSQGLTPGQDVVLGAANFRSEVDLPELPPGMEEPGLN